MELYCPVCNCVCKNRSGISSHLFKTKNEAHINFIELQKKLVIEAFYQDISCTDLKNSGDCFVSTTFICEQWRKMPSYKERIGRMNSIIRKKQWREGLKTSSPHFTNKNYQYSFDHKHTISEETHIEIIKLFDSNLTTDQVASKISCDPKTVNTVWIKEFGEKQTKGRSKRIIKLEKKKAGKSNSVKIKNPKKHQKIIEEFHGDKGLRTISEELKTGTGTIKKAWLESFGNKAYEKRVAKMLRLQQIRAAQSLEKARFLGSKNEILCYKLLKQSVSYEVKHHDYNIVPRLEIDISIPELKVAICWDGIGHRKPVYGIKPFNRVKKNDTIRERVLKEKGWRHIIIVDNGSFNPNFVQQNVDKILEEL